MELSSASGITNIRIFSPNSSRFVGKIALNDNSFSFDDIGEHGNVKKKKKKRRKKLYQRYRSSETYDRCRRIIRKRKFIAKARIVFVVVISV